MSNGDAQNAIAALNGHMHGGRAMKVNEALERSGAGSPRGGDRGSDRGGDRGGDRAGDHGGRRC